MEEDIKGFHVLKFCDEPPSREMVKGPGSRDTATLALSQPVGFMRED